MGDGINMGLLIAMIEQASGADPEQIEQFVQNWLDAHPEATTTVQDGSITLAKLASDLAAKINQVSQLSDEIDEISETKTSKNLFNAETVTIGYFINPANGTLASASAHGTSDFIAVSTNFVISDNRGLANNGLRVAFYDENKSFISGLEPSSFSSVYASNLARYYTSVEVPANTEYIRFSSSAFTQTQYQWDIQLETGSTITAYVPFFEYKTVKQNAIPYDDQIGAVIAKAQMPTVKADTFSDGDVIELPQITFHGRKSYTFFGLVQTMGILRVGHESVYGSSYILVDASQIKVMGNVGSETIYHTFDHGLTIKDYIGISIKVGTNGRSFLEVSTNGGTYSHENVAFMGRNGKIQAVSQGCAMSNVVLSYASDCFGAKVWVCGDSYLSNDNENRWPYHAKAWGYDGFAMIGYPGEASVRGYADFREALNRGTPTYAVWAYGMNDPEQSNSLNSNWLSTIKSFIADCLEKNIEPILSTIPNTPSVINSYKNGWVRASGFRYIDFAKAVGAEATNSTWFDGMLSSDNVHPTEQGAIALASQAISDCPELMLSI